MLFVGLGIFSSPLLANTTKEEGKDQYLNITTVNKGQYEMVKSIVLDKHNVQYMLKKEEDIINFEYTQNTIDNISNMDLFIYNGIGFEPWINNFIDKLNKGSLGIINMSRGIRSLSYEQNGQVGENPYYVLSKDNYEVALYNIKQSIIEKDPKYKEFYEENYNNALKEIEEKQNLIKANLSTYSGYTIITDTDSFDYLFRDLGINTIKLKDKTVNKIIEENNINPKKVIYIKDENPIVKTKAQLEQEEKDKLQDQNKEVEKEEQVELQTITLKRYNEGLSYSKLIEENSNKIIESIKINTENNK